jgi:hypothetical protein
MPVDTSIYSRLQTETPDILGSMQKGANLRQMAMQNDHLGQKMQREDQDYQNNERLRKAAEFGQALESIAGLPEPERAKAWTPLRNELVKNGIVNEQDAPEPYDPSVYGSYMRRWQASKAGIENRLNIGKARLTEAQAEAAVPNARMERAVQQSIIEKNRAEIEKDKAEASAPKAQFGKLPVENQKIISDLAGSNAKKTSIKSQIDSALSILDNPEVDETQKIVIGQQLLKTLNSTEGADAVGSEESKRLGSLLEKKFFNIRQPGSVFGRDLPEFVNQVKLTSGSIGNAIKRNNAEIDKLYGREASEVPGIQIPDTAKTKSPGQEGIAQASNLRKSGSKISTKEIEEYAIKHGMKASEAKDYLRSKGYATD